METLELQYDNLGRMKYHPEFHASFGRRFSEEELCYLAKFYKFDGRRSISMALERPERSIQQKYLELKRNGVVADPFEAILYLATFYERLNDQHNSLNEQRQQWLKEKPHSVMFKSLERHYRRGTMLPHCPKCDSLFDFKDITSWGNAEFYRRLEQKKLEKEAPL